jgi:5-formyltetrahydrofolate cyclo-ligase
MGLLPDKAVLRRAGIERRLKIPPADYARWSQECSARLCYVIEALPTTCTVAGYCPIKGEIDIIAALQRLHSVQLPLALPVTEAGNLLFRTWEPQDELLQGQYSISHSHPDRATVVPEVVIVPLVGFDRSGHRLGYGKGYYDRALSALRAQNPELLTIGAAFCLQEIAAIPAELHDEPLDMVVTESEIIRV